MKRCGLKEEPLGPFFPGSGDSFRSTKDTSSNSSFFPEEQNLVSAPRRHCRKRALPAAPSGNPNPEQELWEEPDKKIPERSRIQQAFEDLEVEPLPNTHYGLQSARNREVPQGTMEHLPVEILRNIFAFLPVSDVFQTLSRVCPLWREIVWDPLFIPWKKTYNWYLMNEGKTVRKVVRILNKFSITKEWEGSVFGLVRLVSSTVTGLNVNPSAVFQSLGSHPLFPKAQICVLQKFPDLESKAGAEKVWATLVLMVLFSDGVDDIRRLLDCVRSPRSELSVLEVMEMLYCMATMLFAMRSRGIPITNRIHYNISYSLYLLESTPGIVQPVEEGRVASSAWSDVKLSHEQLMILNHRIKPGQTVKIMAFAGTGKTLTLVKYAEKFPELKFLFMSFGKAMAEKGKSLFPSNVKCKTFDSLAFQSIGRRYKDKGKLKFRLSVSSITCLLQNQEGQSVFVRGKIVSQTLKNFFSSSDEEICEAHTPLSFENPQGQMELVSRQEKEISVAEAKKIWHNMKKLDNAADQRYKMTCDGYLKLWQLSKPQLSGYDVIFVDEAQDCTPAMMDILQSQKCGKILVGDIHQQIYTFRGNVDTLFTMPHTHLYHLTQGFRFGPEIAYVGATILDVCKGIQTKTVMGGNQKGHVRGAVEGKVALLFRSNHNVFQSAVKFTAREPPAKIHVLGGLQRFRLSRIHDIWKLSKPADVRQSSNLKINDPFIKKWEESDGFVGLKEYAERIGDKDLQFKISVVEKYKEMIPELLERIKGNHVDQESLADFLIGTVYRAKGMEFDTVWIADDFVQIPSVSGIFMRRINIALCRTPEEEWNLLYMAVTRARKCLLMSKSMENILALAGERFLRVELLSEAGQDKDGAPMACCVLGCTNSLELSSGLVVKKLPVTNTNGNRDSGGFLCQNCTQQHFGCLTPLTSFPMIREKSTLP